MIVGVLREENPPKKPLTNIQQSHPKEPLLCWQACKPWLSQVYQELWLVLVGQSWLYGHSSSVEQPQLCGCWAGQQDLMALLLPPACTTLTSCQSLPYIALFTLQHSGGARPGHRLRCFSLQFSTCRCTCSEEVSSSQRHSRPVDFCPPIGITWSQLEYEGTPEHSIHWPGCLCPAPTHTVCKLVCSQCG